MRRLLYRGRHRLAAIPPALAYRPTLPTPVDPWADAQIWHPGTDAGTWLP